MHKFFNIIFLFSIISIISCNEDELIDQLNTKLYSYYPRLEYIVDYKICDESTINGVLNFDEKVLTQIDECESLIDIKLPNNSFIRPLCKSQIFPNQNKNQVLYNSRCNRSEHDYWNCVTVLEESIAVDTHYETNEAYIKYFEQEFKKKDNLLSCYQKAFSTNIAVNDTDNFLGKYAFERFRLNADLMVSGYLIVDPSMRNQTFSPTTEDKKNADFFKCFESLSPDCYAKFNSSFTPEYEAEYKNMIAYTFKHFIIDKMQSTPNLLVKCQSEKFGTIKIKDYYEKDIKNLQNVVDCQKNAMALSEVEKSHYLSVQRLRELFDKDFI